MLLLLLFLLCMFQMRQNSIFDNLMTTRSMEVHTLADPGGCTLSALPALRPATEDIFYALNA